MFYVSCSSALYGAFEKLFDGDVLFEVSSVKGQGTKINISIPSDADHNIGRQTVFLPNNKCFFFKTRDRKKGNNI